MDQYPLLPSQKNRSVIPVVILTAMVTALVTGSLVYAWVRQQEQKDTQSLQQQIADLKTTATPSPSSQPTPSTTPASPVPSNWNTFSSSSYGVSLRYPNDWSVSEQFSTKNTVVSLLSPTTQQYLKSHPQPNESGADFRLVYYTSAKELSTSLGTPANAASLLEYLTSEAAKKNSEGQPDGAIISFTPVTFGTNTGYKVEAPNIGGISYYYFEHNSHVYLITSQDQAADTVKEILSTVKFS